MLTLALPDSPGVTKGTTADTLLVEYNDVQTLRELFAVEGEKIAALIVEPVAGNMGVVPPQPGFLEACRELCTKYGALLIFDEVITGFRVGWGGAQERFGVMPDLTTLGKIIGGGLPVGAFGGRREIMETVAPLGSVYQAGTLSGNPLAMAAGAATLRVLAEPGTYERLEALGARRRAEPARGSRSCRPRRHHQPRRRHDDDVLLRGPGRRASPTPSAADTQAYAAYWRHMLERGIYLAPSQFEAAMISLALTDADLDAAAAAAADWFAGAEA